MTIGDETFPLPTPFLVLATQNPIEQEGTYPLPEAQVDRFMLKLSVGYPRREEERQILDRMALTDARHARQRRSPASPTSSACAALVDADLPRRQGQGVHHRPGRRDARAAGLQARPRAVHPVRRLAARHALPDPGRQGARVPQRPRLRHAAGREVDRRRRAPPPRHVTYEAEAEEHDLRRDRAAHLRRSAGAVRRRTKDEWAQTSIGAAMSRRLPLSSSSLIAHSVLDHPAMLTREQLKAVRKIQIRTSHLVSDLFAGQYHSVFKGRGMEFAEVRQYQPGDEVRTIDWNVTARTGEPHVKRFTEERELTVMLLVDASASTRFGSVRQFKQELAAEIAALLAFSAITNNDKVGLVIFTDRIELALPPRKGTRHVLRVIREILNHVPQGRGTDIPLALDHLEKVVRAALRRLPALRLPRPGAAPAAAGRQPPPRPDRRRARGPARAGAARRRAASRSRTPRAARRCVVDTGDPRLRAEFAPPPGGGARRARPLAAQPRRRRHHRAHRPAVHQGAAALLPPAGAAAVTHAAAATRRGAWALLLALLRSRRRCAQADDRRRRSPPVTTRSSRGRVTIGTPFRYTIEIDGAERASSSWCRCSAAHDRRLPGHGLRRRCRRARTAARRRRALVHALTYTAGRPDRARPDRPATAWPAATGARRRARRAGDRAEPARTPAGRDAAERRARHQGAGRRAARLHAAAVDRRRGAGGASASPLLLCAGSTRPRPRAVAPPRPAHEVALEALASLQAARLIEAGRYEEFYVRLSAIVREYSRRASACARRR